ncbi:MAG: hypothetical protein ACFFKA_05425 [Candidatus Thorarchaeota archaeon]
MRRSKRFFFNLIFVILIFDATIFLEGIDISKANGIDFPLVMNDNFNLEEFAVLNEFKENRNSIDIQLPSDSWKIQDLEINFTGIQFAEEIKEIEANIYPDLNFTIYYQNINDRYLGLAVQINLVEPTILYGVYIYGRKMSGSITKLIQVQITGYDSVNNCPNSTIYRSQNINMSSSPDWYLQSFNPELNLPSGNYFLVLNGSNLNSVQDDRYQWSVNNINPKYPELYYSNFTKTGPWSSGLQNSTLLYKLYQKVNTPKYPETINMTIEVGDKDYQVLDGTEEGTGFVAKITVNFLPNNDIYDVIVKNNATDSLLFNTSFTAIISHEFNAPSTTLIDGSSSNLWMVTPSITRQSNNHSVLFYFPNSWENLSILKNEVNITLDIIINISGHNLWITNNSISDGANWEIIAYSPSMPINLNIQRTKFELGQELRFSLLSPVLSGQYTFVLYDSAATKIYNESRNIPQESSIFSYQLTINGLDGVYTAYVFWYNGVNAGFQSQEFIISFPSNPGIESPFLLFLLLFLFIGAGIGVGLFIGYKKLKSIRRAKLELILDKCSDVAKINYVIVLESRSGIDLFSQSFGGKMLDPTLLSGFLQAIRNFGTEMSEEAKESRTLKLEYKDSIILMTEFVNLKLIITLKENPSPNFKFLMEDLAYDIYRQYGREIEKFSGNLKPFRGIKSLTEKHLNVSFLYPMVVTTNPKVRLSNAEEEIVNRAITFMKENRFEYFYSLYLMPENVCTPKDYQTILSLISKGIFKSIEIENDKS